MSLIKNKKEKGFTLIELLVSMALFSIILVIALGAIITIVDANKKARSLMTVMNNLNFSVDSMTRSFKVGDIAANGNYGGVNGIGGDGGAHCFQTTEIDYDATISVEDAQGRRVKYCFEKVGELGKITKWDSVSGGTSELTSPDIDIDKAYFEIKNQQPLLIINLQGTVGVSPKVRSDFTIQTSVSQRVLNP